MPAVPAVVMQETNAEVLHHLTFDQITRRPQVRKHFDESALQGLAENIRQHGVQQPLLCYRADGQIVLVDGERRYRAALLAELKRVPVRILDDPLSIAEVLARQLSCNLQRDDLNVVERAEGIQQFMIQANLNGDQAAAALGLSPATVSRTLAVNKLPDDLKHLAAEGKILADAAYWLVRVTDQAQQRELATLVAKGELSRDALVARVRLIERTSESEKTQPVEPSGRKPSTPPSPIPKTPVWRMTRTIAPGIALAVKGSEKSLDELLALLNAFITRGREACSQGIPLARFLSTFRADGDAPTPEIQP